MDVVTWVVLWLLVSGLGWCGAAAAAPFAYITNSGDGTVSVVDARTNTVATTIPVGQGPTGVAVNGAGTRVYVTNITDGTVSVIDTATNAVAATVPVGSLPAGIAVNPAGSRVYVTNFSSSVVSIVDAVSNTMAGTIDVGNNPAGITIDPAGRFVYVANALSNSVSVIDTVGEAVVDTIQVASQPEGVAVNPSGSRLYVTNNGSDLVSIIDTATRAVIGSLAVGAFPAGIVVNAAGSRVYVANTSGSVSVIDTSDNHVSDTIPVPDGSPNALSFVGLALYPAGTRLYVAGSNSSLVSVIDTTRNTVTTSIQVGTAPAAFGQFMGPCGSNDDCDDGNACTSEVCNPSTGRCDVSFVQDGLACDDGNACTSADACLAGTCTGAARDCTDPNPCTDDSCDPATGACLHVNTALPCDDASECTTGDVCQGGSCTGQTVSCNDGNPCTDDGCNPATGCVRTNNTLPCDDRNACTTGDTCNAGSCTGQTASCDDGNPCTDDNCDPATGCVRTDNTATCDDGNACTTADRCQAGQCVGGPALGCDDGNPCTDDPCDPVSGCHHSNNTVPCDDHNVCTSVDTCQNGACVGQAALGRCDDGNPCTDDSCDPVNDCRHTNNTAPCSDGNACSVSDTCQGGNCVGGPALGCDDGNPCTDDGCNPASGCVRTHNTASCDDNNACTGPDRCQAGQCGSGPPISCDDANPCTDDSCVPSVGCVRTNNTAICNDHNACTLGDTCQGGTCRGPTAFHCDDGNPCTDDACDPVRGCTTTNNSASCSDLNLCTVGDTCQGGQCVPGGPLGCEDGNSCTDDICDSAMGCLHADNSGACSDGNSCTTGDVCNGAVCVGGNRGSGCTACQAVATIPAQGGTFVGTTSGTSSLTGSCANTSSPERVYRWVPVTSGIATIRTCSATGTIYDTVVYIRQGSCTSGTEIACNDDTDGCPVGDGLANSGRHGSVITPSVTAGQTYFIVVDGYAGRQGAYTLTVIPPTVCGNGVREGAEECDGGAVAGCVSGQCRPDCRCVPPSSGLPDLTPEIADVNVQLNATVSAGDVAEGCAESTAGVDLLRFTVKSRNVGTADFFLGDPRCPSPCTSHPLETCGNPDFICSPAEGHNHAHYNNYARYDLLDGVGQAVIVGHKQGFCLRDTQCANPRYTCSNQGITAGCADTYGSNLGCQYLDVTGVPAGSYMLRVITDPFGRIAELSETNNVATVPVTIPSHGGTTTTTLPGSTCPSPTVIPAAGGVFTGTTSGASAQTGSCGASGTAPERVFQWTPGASGTATIETCSTSATTYDTVLYLRQGTCGGSELACNDDTTGCGTTTDVSNPHRGSRLTPTVTAGQTYFILVDGYNGAAGAFRLAITPPGGGTTTTVPVTTTTTLPGSACTSPTVIPAVGGVFTGTTNGASTQTGSCGASGTAPERVFQWTPVASGTATIETCSTSATTYDTVLYLRQGTCGGAELACNDDTTGCGTTTDVSNPHRGSRLTPTVTAGQTYFVVVDGYSGNSGTYRLAVTPPGAATSTTTTTVPVTTTTTPAPCTNPIVIPSAGGTFTGATSGSSMLAGSCGTSGSSPERVFQWKPAKSGTATVRTCGTTTTYDTVLYVRQGACQSGTEVACNDDTPGCAVADGSSYHGSTVTPAVTAGTTYYIVVDGYAGRSGSFGLTVIPPP